MTETEFAEELERALSEGEVAEELSVERVRTFADACILTQNAGIVVRLADGSEYQVTVVRSR